MYYKTKIDSETGMKFQKMLEKAEKCIKKRSELLDSIDVDEYRQGYWSVYGGISSVVMKNDDYCRKTWKPCKDGAINEVTPRGNTKLGKAMQKDFYNLPVVSTHDLNMCIGLDEVFSQIGFNNTPKDFFLFNGDYEWLPDTMPEDCIEITKTEYDSILKDI